MVASKIGRGNGGKRGNNQSQARKGWASPLCAALIFGLFCGCLWGLPSVSLAATVTATWEHHPTAEAPDIPDGFRLYQRAKDGPPFTLFGQDHAVASSGKGVWTAKVENVPDGHWCYVVTAFDLKGNESLPSEEACTEIDTKAPASPTKPILEVIVQIKMSAGQ